MIRSLEIGNGSTATLAENLCRVVVTGSCGGKIGSQTVEAILLFEILATLRAMQAEREETRMQKEKPPCECVTKNEVGVWVCHGCDCQNTGDLADASAWAAAQNCNDRIAELEAENARLKAELEGARRDAAFYRSCAMSGEVPEPGSEPSAAMQAEREET